MSYNGRNSLEKLNYRQVQRISKNFKLPSHYKKQQLIDIIYAKMEGRESEVDRLIEKAKKERNKAHRQKRESAQRIQAREISSTMGSSVSPVHTSPVVIDRRPNATIRYPRRDRISTTQYKSLALPNRKPRLKNYCDQTCSLLHDAVSNNDLVQERVQFPIYNKYGTNTKRSKKNTDNEPSSTVDSIIRRKPVLRSLLDPLRENDSSLLMTNYLNVTKNVDSKLTISTQLKAGLSTSTNQEISEGPIDYTKKTSSDNAEKNNYEVNAPLAISMSNSTYNSKKAYYENRNLFEKTYIRYRPYKQNFDKIIFLYRRRIHRVILSQTENDNDTNMDLNHQDDVNNMSVNNISLNSIQESNNILDNNFDSNIPTAGIYRDDVYMLQMDNLVNSIASDQTQHFLEVQRNEPDYLIQELGEERNDSNSNTISNADVSNLCNDIDIDNNDLLMTDETSKDFPENSMNVYYHKKMKAKMLLKERSQNSNTSEEKSPNKCNYIENNMTSLPSITQAFSQFVPQNSYENSIETIDNSLPLDIGMIETYNQNYENCPESVCNFKKDMIVYPVMSNQQDFSETAADYKQECVSPPLAHQNNMEHTNNVYNYDGLVSFNNMVPNMEYSNNSLQDGITEENQNRFIGNNNQVSYPLIYEYLQSSEKEVLLKSGVVTENNSSYNTSLEDIASQIEDIEESENSENNTSGLDLLQYSDTNLGASVTVPELDENAFSFIYEETAYPATNQNFSDVDDIAKCCFCEWIGPISTLESHIKQEHQSEILEVYTADFEQELSLGTLIDWPSSVLTSVLEYKSRLLLLRVKYENPDFILASLAIIPSRSNGETLFNMSSISVFNKVTGEPFSWKGALPQLHSNQLFQSADTYLRVQISQLDLLPNSANIVLLNGKLVPLSPSKPVVCGQIHLNDIIIKFYVTLFRDS